MECEGNGSKCWAPARAARGVKRKRRVDDAGGMHLPYPITMSGPAVTKQVHNHFHPSRNEPTNGIAHTPTSDPFMNNMDEITYWVYTKRAPCLYNYDKLMKKRSDEAHSSREVSGLSFPIDSAVPSPKKRKKVLDEDSYVTEKQQNIYFEQQHVKHTINNFEPVSPGPKIEVNIKNTSSPKITKSRLQKNSKNNVTKRNKVVTSTPKTEHQNLRRSLRLQQSLNNSGLLDSSLEIITEDPVNGVRKTCSQEKKGEIERAVDNGTNKNTTHRKTSFRNTTRIDISNIDDYSDVSGFTANYIRSTKVSKTPKKVMRKSNKLMQDSKQNFDPDSKKMIICVNKSMNTGEHASVVLNNSTDSSQNVINLVTVSNNNRSRKVNKSTSLVKFVDSQGDKVCEEGNGNFLNDSFQSGSSATSRYPKRSKTQKKDKHNKTNENSPEKFTYRTRSQKRLQQDSNDKLNSINASSNAVINVAGPGDQYSDEAEQEGRSKKKTSNLLEKCVRKVRKSMEKRQALKKNSLRDKSGFAACFSDSDSDVDRKPRKYFG